MRRKSWNFPMVKEQTYMKSVSRSWNKDSNHSKVGMSKMPNKESLYPFNSIPTTFQIGNEWIQMVSNIP